MVVRIIAGSLLILLGFVIARYGANDISLKRKGFILSNWPTYPKVYMKIQSYAAGFILIAAGIAVLFK